MKIGVVSDTHDHVEVFDKVAQIFQQNGVGMVVHCGDWVAPFAVARFAKVMLGALPNIPIQGVFGNNDGDHYHIIQVLEQEGLAVGIEKDILEIPVEGGTIAVYHGTEEKIVNALIGFGQYKAVFRGHTHVPGIAMSGSTLHLNPGTVSSFSQGQILKQGSVAIYTAETNSGELVYFDR